MVTVADVIPGKTRATGNTPLRVPNVPPTNRSTIRKSTSRVQIRRGERRRGDGEVCTGGDDGTKASDTSGSGGAGLRGGETAVVGRPNSEARNGMGEAGR